VPASAKRQQSAGVVAAASAYLMWGLFPIYFHALQGVPAGEVLAHRVVWSALFMAALVTALRRWPSVLLQLRRPGSMKRLTASALFISTNWLVYIWAVQSGRVLEASLGYFITPLVSVLLGVVFLHEPLSRRQIAAVVLAAAGVLWLVGRVGQVPWVALTLAGSFGLYGLLRKQLAVDAVAGLFAEVAVLTPLAGAWLAWLTWRGQGHLGATPGVTALLLLAGVVTAVPLLLFAVGVQRLTLATVGLLLYVNPTTQFVLAVWLFGEVFTTAHAIAFGCIWASLALYSSEAIFRRGPSLPPDPPARGAGGAAAPGTARPPSPP
jgi:chloramphenicol-sensitive protein RarD